MTISDAAAIVQRLGPCRIRLDHGRHADLAVELGLLGCELVDVANATSASPMCRAGIMTWPVAPSATDLARHLRPFETADALVVVSSAGIRADVEDGLFANGWRRHPAGMMAEEAAQWSDDTLPRLTYYQRAGAGCAVTANVLAGGGAVADLFVARFAAAARHVRPGDRVLVDSAGGGDGTRILATLSLARSFACVCPGDAPLMTDLVDHVGADLADIPDHSVDMIVALDPAMPGTWQARLEDYARVLTFDGRMLVGWPGDPDAGRSIPSDWLALAAEAEERFLPELRYVQRRETAGGPGSRGVHPVGLDATCPSDWMILVASANPFSGEGHAAMFRYPAFPAPAAGAPTVVDFATGYDNPYLYRVMVQMGERLVDDIKLSRLAECVIEDARPDSADRGAAIAVLGYRVLERRMAAAVPTMLGLIHGYVALCRAGNMAPHVARWCLSLTFLAGRLNELAADRDAAIACYRAAAAGDWRAFSPILATKAVAACFYEGRLHLSGGDTAQARTCFQRGVATALAAATTAHDPAMGDPDRPVPFYLQELAEVIDMGSQCANAVTHLPLWSRDPGLFWRQVDVRRFGVGSWAKDVERENAALRARA